MAIAHVDIVEKHKCQEHPELTFSTRIRYVKCLYFYKSSKYININFLWSAKMSAIYLVLCLRQGGEHLFQLFFSHTFLMP